MIDVQRVDDTTFRVTVQDAATTVHTVTVEPAYYQRLTDGKVVPEELMRRSFEFLLERESNTRILRSFALPVIEHYFPEYERTIRSMLS